jgi:DNA-directed RNA polymerase subunit omega
MGAAPRPLESDRFLLRAQKPGTPKNQAGFCLGTKPGTPRIRKENEALIHPRIDKLLEHSDSHYAAVIVAAKRARQINNYYHTLGEGVFEEFPPPMVDTPSKNYLTISLEELAQGKLAYRYRV